VRRFVLIGSGVLLLIAVGLFVAGSLTPPRPSPWVLPPEPPPPPPEPIPVLPPVEPDPNSPYTPHEQAIRRYLTRGRADRESKRSMALEARDERAFVAAGGYTPAAFPFYLRLLAPDSGIDWRVEAKILDQVSRIPGDRTAFRKPAVERLKHPKRGLVGDAIRLLKEIGTPAEAAEVVKLIENFEFDRPGERLRDDMAYSILDTLAAIGSEAEIKALDQAKARNFLWDNDKFWTKAEECKTAIRERLAKEKAEKK
jgi:hypothetical protein